MIIISILVFCTAFAASAYARSKDGYTIISTSELKTLLDSKAKITVVDARSPEEYQEAHIKGAISVPVDQWDKYDNRLPADKSSKIVFYCNGVKCGKSKKAGRKALEMGYDNVYVYAEGMPVWEAKGMPFYKGPGYEKHIPTKRISPQDLYALIKSNTGGFTIVDVRDPQEFKKGHIPGAINLPLDTFDARSTILDKHKKIIVYCNSGSRSYDAYRKLMKRGYTNINQAIFADWKAAKFPVAQSH